MERNTCKNCIYFNAATGEENSEAECHYHPPMVVGTHYGAKSMFPTTTPNSVACSNYFSMIRFERNIETAKSHGQYEEGI